MNYSKPTIQSPPGASSNHPNQKDEWEDWDEEGEDTHEEGEDGNGFLIQISDETGQVPTRSTTTQNGTRNASRHSVQRPVRLKSKGRQKAQNAKAGIKLVTDMSTFRRPVKFVDPTALHALEGSPSSASIGSFSWLKRKPGNAGSSRLGDELTRGTSADLSPAARPIVIGIAVPSDNLSEHQVSPQTAIIETPIDMRKYPQKTITTTTTGNATYLTSQQQRSVWSPDTEASESPHQASRAASSVYSQPSFYGGPVPSTDVPPVPALPANLKPKPAQGTWLDDPDDDDSIGTPCTLFEEDGSPLATRKSLKPKAVTVSPGSAGSRSHGWWDHVTTPFMQQTNPFKQQTQENGHGQSSQQWNPFNKQQVQAGPSASPPTQDWWAGGNEKAGSSESPLSKQQGKEATSNPLRVSGLTSNTVVPAPEQQGTSQPVGTPSRSASPGNRETQSEKGRVLLEENRRPSESPPPYSPPKKTNQVKFGVILPPPDLHIYNAQPVPSPGPMSSGLPGTMTSQGAIDMAEIPLTPSMQRSATNAVLPDRAPGSYVPGDHFFEVRGQANRTEKQRRRHEKEEIAARKAGGLWRGRGCISNTGCFGRSGREGRKRRRICLGVIAGVIIAIILAIVLAVVFTRQHPVNNSQPFSIWLNLTDFPPMPTGVVTVAGPDNSEARSGCMILTAETAWSCSLPKEQHDSVAPNPPNKPEFILQIQYDNNTKALWQVANDGEGSDKFLTDAGFTPNPQPPSIAEMRFLGNTTDHIEADEKAGEATPFFISLLKSVNETIGPNMLTRRQGANNAIGSADGDGFNLTNILPPPTLNGDGTGGPARLFPLPVQQPVRLFDRGLPTEHYGFYSYFDKTIYMVNTVSVDAADDDGGARESEAKSLVTFAQTRFLVQIWTRKENTTRLLGGSAVPWTNGSDASASPGTMPYPVTITEDMHGGDQSKKIDFTYGVTPAQEVNTTDAKLIITNRGFAGTLINGMNNSPDESLGGIDGGTGGCRCQWINFQGLTKTGS